MKRILNNIADYFMDISQVLFFRNGYFGFLFLASSLIFDFDVIICGVFASLFGFSYSKLYNTPKLLKDGGLLTINGFFFGIAMASLFHQSPQFYFALVAGTLAIPLVTKASFEVLQHWKLSPFIISYILVVWVVYLGAPTISLALQSQQELQQNMIYVPTELLHPDTVTQVVVATLTSMGRLFFLPSGIYGCMILALISVFSPRRGIYFFVGTALATAAAFLLSANSSASAEYGLYSYCAGLIGLGLASWPEKFHLQTIFLFCVLSVFLTLATEQFLDHLSLPTLSLPYILTLWIALLSRAPRVNVSWAPTVTS